MGMVKTAHYLGLDLEAAHEIGLGCPRCVYHSQLHLTAGRGLIGAIGGAGQVTHDRLAQLVSGDRLAVEGQRWRVGVEEERRERAVLAGQYQLEDLLRRLDAMDAICAQRPN